MEIGSVSPRAIYIDEVKLVESYILLHFDHIGISTNSKNLYIKLIMFAFVKIDKFGHFFFAMAACRIPKENDGKSGFYIVQRNRLHGSVEHD